MNQARALRELQAALHLRIDAAYAPLPSQIRRAVSHHAQRRQNGPAALTFVAAALAEAQIRRLFDAADERAARTIAQGIAAAAVLAEQTAPDPESAWREAAGFAAALSLLRVRRALADGRQRAMAQVRRTLVDAARTGRDAELLALHLSEYADPRFATRRDALGVLRRAGRIGHRRSWPAVPGNAAAPARGLMLTEVSAAHGRAVVGRAQRTPGSLVEWNVSPWHAESDACDANAARDSGFGPGVYDPFSVPAYPAHRRCACVLTIA